MPLVPKLSITPNPARVGDKLVVKASGVGGPTSASYTSSQTGANNSIVFTASPLLSGANGSARTITLTAGATGTALTTVGATGVTGNDVNVVLAMDSSDAVIATANEVIAAINNNARANAVLTAALNGTATGLGTVLALAKTNLTGGVNANTTGVAQIQICSAGFGAVVGQTGSTITKEGVMDFSSGSVYSYELDKPGPYIITLINGTGTTQLDQQSVQVWTA